MRPAIAVAIAAALLLVAACGDGDPTAAGTAPTRVLPQGDEAVQLDPASFTTEIDNRYWPMSPGRRWTYREVDEEGKRLDVVVTVTAATKTSPTASRRGSSATP